MPLTKRCLAILAFLTVFAAEGVADEPTSLTTVQNLAQAMVAQDANSIERIFTADAGYAYSLEGSLSRGAHFDSWLTSDITGPGSIFEIEEATVRGNIVDALVVWGRGGDASTEARYVFTVIDGQIDSWRMVGR